MYETRIRALREDKDLKQKEVANYLDIPPHTYSNYENGLRSLPLDILVKLAEFYHTIKC